MPQPRYTQIDIDATADYHVISRCVRRAFLCGYDRTTDRCFDHRKEWVREKLADLTASFAIRLHSYSVLSNHFHLVLRIESPWARAWSDAEVVARYARLFPRTAHSWIRQGVSEVLCFLQQATIISGTSMSNSSQTLPTTSGVTPFSGIENMRRSVSAESAILQWVEGVDPNNDAFE